MTMDNMNLNKHLSGQFNTELEAVRNNVLAMGGLVEQQLADALVAIHDQDLELARRIVETDLRVNDMEISIDEECTRIIAKRQPTASDLRLILMISKAVTDLERMGDVADKLARMVINNTSRSHPPLVSLESMGRQALEVLWAARSLERIGDRCQHISDYIIYCVKGKDVRHTKISDLGSL